MKSNLYNRWFSVLLVCLLIFVVSGCSKDEGGTQVSPDEILGVKGDLTVQFSARFGTEPFAAAKGYAYQGKQKVMFSKVEFYITDIQLVGTNRAASDQAGLINLTGSTEASKNISLTGLASGHYTGIEFTLGVTPALNKKSPRDFPPSNPLSLSGGFWEDWGSYIFTQILGLVDPEGSGHFTNGFAIQTGTDECSVKVTIEKDITIKESKPASITLDVDVLQFFKQGSTYYDLIADPLSHNIGDLGSLRLFAEAIAKAIVLKE